MATTVSARRSRVRAVTPDPFAIRVYSWVVTGVFVSASIIGWRRSAVTTMENVNELIAFTLAAMAADFLRVRLWRDMSFSVSLPVLLAAGMILPPWQAAAVAFIGSMDVQEIRRGVPFSRMAFNRSEIGLSVMAASAAFHALMGDNVSWPSVLVPSLVALAVDAAVNAALVAWPVAKLHAVSTGDVVRRMFGPRYGESLLRYVGVGLMAPLIAVVWLTTGAYGLAAFLIPLGLAWSSYVEAERLRRASEQIETKNQSLLLALDEIAAERRDERLVLAGELHDSVLPAMFKVQLMGQVMRQDLAEGKLLDLEDDLPPLNEAISEAQIRVRGVTGGLRESSVGPGGLASALKSLASDLETVSSTRFDLDLDEVEATDTAQLVAYHVGREAMMNATKHSKADLVSVLLKQTTDGVSLEIRDSGVGFAPRFDSKPLHFGMELMAERAEAAGGRLSIESFLGKGTTVSLFLPKLESISDEGKRPA